MAERDHIGKQRNGSERSGLVGPPAQGGQPVSCLSMARPGPIQRLCRFTILVSFLPLSWPGPDLAFGQAGSAGLDTPLAQAAQMEQNRDFGGAEKLYRQ